MAWVLPMTPSCSTLGTAVSETASCIVTDDVGMGLIQECYCSIRDNESGSKVTFVQRQVTVNIE